MVLDKTVTLSDGVVRPSLGFGTYPMRGKEAVRAIRTALETGYRLIDTASMYRNEREVGEAVRESGIPREEIFITTKVDNNEHGYERAIKACNMSLDHLGVGYIDLYLIHWPVEYLRTETWRAMIDLREKGYCRSIGVSNYTAAHLEELIDQFEVRPTVNQVEFHPFLFQRGLLEFCKSEDILLEAYTPLARGRVVRDNTVKEIAAAHGKTPAQVVLRWNHHHGTAPIPKASGEQHIRENFAVWDFELSDDEVRRIDQAHGGKLSHFGT